MVKQGTRYKEIAIDVAHQIIKGNIVEGSKLKGRSVLAGNYQVSPETIRKAIALLEKSFVVKVIPSSGIIVLSKERAIQFVAESHDKEKLKVLKNDLKELLEEKDTLEGRIDKTMKAIIEQSLSIDHEYKDFLFLELPVMNSSFQDRPIGDCGFWQETGGTIVAIRRDESLIISPNPMEILNEEDIIVYIKRKGSEP